MPYNVGSNSYPMRNWGQTMSSYYGYNQPSSVFSRLNFGYTQNDFAGSNQGYYSNNQGYYSNNQGYYSNNQGYYSNNDGNELDYSQDWDFVDTNSNKQISNQRNQFRNYQNKNRNTQARKPRRNINPRCYECGKSFTSYRAMYAHKDAEHQKICNMCGKSFASHSLLVKHEKTHTIFACGECPEVFRLKDLLIAHTTQAHAKDRVVLALPPPDPKAKEPEPTLKDPYQLDPPVAASTPASSFSDKTEETHDSGIKIESEPVQCPYCIKQFATEPILQKHLRVHTEAETKQSVFPCPHCDTAFGSNDELQAHTKIHSQVTHSLDSDSPTFFCPFCAEPFSGRRNLALHMTSRHTPIFYCQKCVAEFSTEAELNAHRKTHYEQ